MNLHHKPIFEAHPRHLCQHLRSKSSWCSASASPSSTFPNSHSAFDSPRSAVFAVMMPMIRSRGTQDLEELPSRFQRSQITAPRGRIFSCQLAQSSPHSRENRETQDPPPDRAGTWAQSVPSIQTRESPCDRPAYQAANPSLPALRSGTAQRARAAEIPSRAASLQSCRNRGPPSSLTTVPVIPKSFSNA